VVYEIDLESGQVDHWNPFLEQIAGCFEMSIL